MPSEPQPDRYAQARQFLRIGIVLMTVLGLAFTAQSTLGPRIASLDQSSSAFEIRVRESDTGGAHAGKSELWITDLIVDGRLARGDSLELPVGWERAARRGSGLPASLLSTGGSGAGALRLQGKHLVVVLEPVGWTGVVHLSKGSREVQSVHLKASYDRMALEAPVSPRSTGVFLSAVLLFSGAAVLSGSLWRHRTGLPWVAFALATLHLLFWVSQCVGTTNDSPDYANSIHRIIGGLPAYFPPGYPAFMGIISIFASSTLGTWSTLAQHAMAVGAALWIYLLLRRLGPEELAMIGALLAGGLAHILTMSQSIMSEIPTMFAMVGAFYFAVRSAETGRPRWAILAGLLAGWAGLSRVVPLAALLPAICILHLLPGTRRNWRLPVLAVAVSSVLVLLPVFWFWYSSGRAQLTDSAGYHLFNRVVAEQKQLDEEGPATRKLLAMLEGRDPRGLKWWDVTAHPSFHGQDGVVTERLLRDVAIEGFRKDPFGYLRLTPRLALRELFADPVYYIPAWAATIDRFPRLETPPLTGFSAASLRWRWGMERVHRVVWPWLCLAAVMGSIIGMWLRQRLLVSALAWIPLSYLMFSASLESFSPRHNVPLIPFVAALGMVPLAVLMAGHAARTQRRTVLPSPADTVTVP